jgi:tyrosine-protein kinase Etk/Wzc
VNLLLGSMLGLSLGLTFAFLRDQVDRKIHAKKDVERETGLEVLTLIPHVSAAESVLPVVVEEARQNGMTPLASLPARRSWISPAEDEGQGAGPSDSASSDYEWTPALESFRSLATDIDFAVAKLAATTNPVIAVTSAQQGEGKTYTSSNLAVVSASFGRRTLLIDADMRSAGVSRFFGFSPDLPGLSDVLAGRIQAFRAWQTVRVLGSNALTVIPAGDVDAAMLHHGTQRGLHELIELSRTLFDLVIVDGPPLNLVSDSAVVAANVDAVLFVVRSGSSTPVAVKLSLERLRRATPHLLGVVLNDVGRHEHASPYSYYGYEGRRRRDT